jgi:oxygen-independent coproporphyrinogen-3 oxidase
MSFGMQSVRSNVLAVLERSHTPGAARRAVADAHAAGFAHVSLDLIYGTPGETDADWQASLDAALAAGPDHVSAYALTIEPRTRLAAQVRQGRLPAPDEDVLVRRYHRADDVLTAAGLSWYELSNWASSPEARCRHNLLYWRNHHWWGIGPGAHSHIGGTRWWNEAHPEAYAARVTAGALPVAGHEVLDHHARQIEDVLLAVRLAEGFRVGGATSLARELVDDGLVTVVAQGNAPVLVLSRRGRLLADLVARRVLEHDASPGGSLPS